MYMILRMSPWFGLVVLVCDNVTTVVLGTGGIMVSITEITTKNNYELGMTE